MTKGVTHVRRGAAAGRGVALPVQLGRCRGWCCRLSGGLWPAEARVQRRQGTMPRNVLTALTLLVLTAACSKSPPPQGNQGSQAPAAAPAPAAAQTESKT